MNCRHNDCNGCNDHNNVGHVRYYSARFGRDVSVPLGPFQALIHTRLRG